MRRAPGPPAPTQACSPATQAGEALPAGLDARGWRIADRRAGSTPRPDAGTPPAGWQGSVLRSSRWDITSPGALRHPTVRAQTAGAGQKCDIRSPIRSCGPRGFQPRRTTKRNSFGRADRQMPPESAMRGVSVASRYSTNPCKPDRSATELPGFLIHPTSLISAAVRSFRELAWQKASIRPTNSRGAICDGVAPRCGIGRSRIWRRFLTPEGLAGSLDTLSLSDRVATMPSSTPRGLSHR